MIELSAKLLQEFPDRAFDRLLAVTGKIHRQFANRRTVEFEAGGRRYFVKAQTGCGWGEIAKNLFSGRLPVISSRTEWTAIQALHDAGISTLRVAGRGLRGWNPARLESFVVTEALEGMISLEQLTSRWQELPPRARAGLKRALLREIALMARRMHQAGLNHRDFYLCHFLARDREWAAWTGSEPAGLVLIDLHRVQQREAVPERWVVKDLGGLLFSALDAGLTRRDLLRFMETYRGRPWREVLETERDFWARVWRNAVELYVPFHKRQPPLSWSSP